MRQRQVSCSCGQLRLACEGEPVHVAMCHCLECQRRTGSTFGVQGWFPREKVRLVAGADKTYARQADSGRVVTFYFCPECGGAVFWESERAPGLIAVAVGMFADPDFEAPHLSVWERRRHPWAIAIGSQQMEHSD
jgi:hypothetical protein